VTVATEVAEIVGAENVRSGPALASYLTDATEVRELAGAADAAVAPATPGEAAEVMRWCYEHDVPITTRGGGTGYAGGCVPRGGLVLSLERLNRMRALDPLLWRVQPEAAVTTRTLQRIARENGLTLPPNPGAAEQSHIGGNLATNAGGPRAFKYGSMGAWVTGLEVVVPPGDVVTLGGPVRKDVAGYDLVRLMVGSEGTLGVITAAWLRLIPAPEAAFPVIGLYPDVASGVAAVEAAMASGTVPSLIEYLDVPCVAIAREAFPFPLPRRDAFMVVVEADGDSTEAERGRDLLQEALADGSVGTIAPTGRSEIEALWRWREGVPIAVDSALGGKISEDIAVPLDRLADAIDGTSEIGDRLGVRTCSWGHAGDGNLHSSFLFDRGNQADLARAQLAAEQLFELALRLGGTISGEHGVGLVKSGRRRETLTPTALGLDRRIKESIDPKGLLNPGKKEP
jgi:FAD/FMN-containing dehydrogenase